MRSVLYSAGLNTAQYNVSALRLAGAAKLIKMKDNGTVAYSSGSLTWLLAKSGWLDRTAIDACCHAVNHSLLVIQPLSVNGKLKDDQHLEMGLTNTAKHHQLAAVTNAYIWDKKPFHDMVTAGNHLDIGEHVSDHFADIASQQGYNHFVSIVDVRSKRNNLDVLNESARDFNERVVAWTDYFLERFEAVVKTPDGRKGTKSWFTFTQRCKQTQDYHLHRLTWWDLRSKPVNPVLDTLAEGESLINAVLFNYTAEPPESEKYFEILRLLVCQAQINDRSDRRSGTRGRLASLVPHIQKIIQLLEVNINNECPSVAKEYPVDREMSGSMDFCYLKFEARKLPPDVSMENSFYASVATQLGLHATPRDLVVLRCMAFMGLFEGKMLSVLDKNNKDIIPLAKMALNPYVEPAKYVKMALIRSLSVGLRHIFTISPGSVFNPEWLIECSDNNYAVDSKKTPKRLFILQVKGLGHRPLSKTHIPPTM